MTWADGVNTLQQRAIEARGHVAVVAGPGTGKTRTLLGKAMQLVEEEIAKPAEVQLVNFTNAGVRDLRRKIAADSSYSRLSPDRVSTFHSLALRTLLAVESRGLSRPLLILDDWEEAMFIDLLTNAELGLRDVRKAKKLRDDYNARWCQASDDLESWMNEQRRTFEQAYQKAQGVLGFVTRGELTFLWWKHLRANPGASLAELAISYRFLLVDEYQDLNECEHDILRMLAKCGVTIFAVGDANQSIYETMRHAHPEFCSDFPKRLGGGAIHFLDESYRCPEMVLRAGRALLNDREGIPNSAKAKIRGEVAIVRFPDHTAEASGLAQFIRYQLNRDPKSRVLVAIPKRSVAKPFVLELTRLGVVVDDRTARLEKPDDGCRYARALLKLTRERANSVAAATALVLACPPTTRKQRAVELIRLAYSNSVRVSDLLIKDVRLMSPLTKASEVVRRDLQRLAGASDVDAELRAITGCQDMQLDGDDSLSANDIGAVEGLESGRATIMTLHACKGLEADVVVLPAVEPGFYEQGTVGREADERRRMLYVGITRALQTAVLSYASRRYGSDRYRDPTGSSPVKGCSKFVDDIASDPLFEPVVGSEFLKRRLAK